MPQRSAPIPRVRRDRRDDSYQAGHAAPIKRASAGWVLSVEADDSVTVVILEEEISGVIPLDDVPTPGAIVEVETRGDLLVIVNWFEHPLPPQWQTLPDVMRVMVPAGYTTPQGTNGWAPSGSEFGLHSQRLSIYTLNGPVFNPISTFNDPGAWACLYPHVLAAEEGSPYYNTPTTRVDWSGSATCAPPTGPVLIGANATSGVNGASSRIASYSSGGADYIKGECRSTACWIHLPNIKSSRFTGQLGSPSGGLPDPVPPPGFTLVWENPTSTLSKIEAAIAEPVTNSNSGPVYMLKRTPGDGRYGPVDPTGSSLNWYVGNSEPGGSMVPAYSGGEHAWTNVTADIETTGRTWLLFVAGMLHDHTPTPTGTHPIDERPTTRLDLRPAFRFSISPSRFKFVPEGG